MTAAPVRVTLVVRDGCHLCVPARETVARVCAELGVGWEEVDVDADEDRRARWSEEVPVTLVDGRQHDFWRVDETRLRSALAAPPRPPAGTP
ncbi:glutaredoxin family protein [Phycicoccus sp. CSK15P-2]|uniref:glutaredoxin family protein n=1 Tax=Phycicoccus sp. CSK15P-2 TaxID=2807627 RepID=UPI00194EE951|nr:glutaredoxin family protein [Phycicoccus sp. CSK15P-2]MBM6406134.1 glutaredoxin family protein [Phycicoccus sp. CSK15P-2]